MVLVHQIAVGDPIIINKEIARTMTESHRFAVAATGILTDKTRWNWATGEVLRRTRVEAIQEELENEFRGSIVKWTNVLEANGVLRKRKYKPECIAKSILMLMSVVASHMMRCAIALCTEDWVAPMIKFAAGAQVSTRKLVFGNRNNHESRMEVIMIHSQIVLERDSPEPEEEQEVKGEATAIHTGNSSLSFASAVIHSLVQGTAALSVVIDGTVSRVEMGIPIGIMGLLSGLFSVYSAVCGGTQRGKFTPWKKASPIGKFDHCSYWVSNALSVVLFALAFWRITEQELSGGDWFLGMLSYKIGGKIMEASVVSKHTLKTNSSDPRGGCYAIECVLYGWSRVLFEGCCLCLGVWIIGIVILTKPDIIGYTLSAVQGVFTLLRLLASVLDYIRQTRKSAYAYVAVIAMQEAITGVAFGYAIGDLFGLDTFKGDWVAWAYVAVRQISNFSVGAY